MQTNPLPPADTIEELPSCLQEIANNLIKMNTLRPKQVRQVVIDASIQPEVLMPWSDFTHSTADSYGRRLVYDGGFFEMMVMSWCPGDVSAIHDHGYTEWGAVQIFGPAEHATFLVQDDEITCLSRTLLKAGQTMGVGHHWFIKWAIRHKINALLLSIFMVIRKSPTISWECTRI